MHESPLFAVSAREAASAQPARRLSFRGLRRRIARLGMVAVAVASLSVAGSANAAAPFDATGCTNGTVSCIATGGTLYPYVADPRYVFGSGYPYAYGAYGAYGAPGVVNPYTSTVPYGYGYGYGYGVPPYGYGTYGYSAYGYPGCVLSNGDCDVPGSPFYGYNVYPPPTAKPFSAYPSTALITPTPLPVYPQYAPPPLPPQAPAVASASPAASAAVATPKVTVTTGSAIIATTVATTATPAPQQNPIVVPPVGATTNTTAGATTNRTTTASSTGGTGTATAAPTTNQPIVVPPVGATTGSATPKTTP